MNKINNIYIGHHAGEYLTSASDIAVIGDGIREVPDGASILIGKTVAGKENPIYKIVRAICELYAAQLLHEAE